MPRLLAFGRAAAIAALAGGLAPLQWLAVRRGWRLASRLPVFFHRAALRIIGLRIEKRGAPPGNGAMLIVANHASWLDIPVVGSLLPVSFVARADMLGWPGVGVLARLQRSVFVDRTRRQASGVAAGTMARRLGDGDALVLFAEGTTSDGNRVLAFRSALFGAVQAIAGAPGQAVAIQPLCLAYRSRGGLPLGRAARAQVAWYGDMTLGPHLLGVLGGGPLDVVAIWGEPVVVTGQTDRKLLAAVLESRIRAEFSAALTGRGEPADQPILKPGQTG